MLYSSKDNTIGNSKILLNRQIYLHDIIHCTEYAFLINNSMLLDYNRIIPSISCWTPHGIWLAVRLFTDNINRHRTLSQCLHVCLTISYTLTWSRCMIHHRSPYKNHCNHRQIQHIILEKPSPFSLPNCPFLSPSSFPLLPHHPIPSTVFCYLHSFSSILPYFFSYSRMLLPLISSYWVCETVVINARTFS